MEIYLKEGINVVEVLELCGYTVVFSGDEAYMATKVVGKDENGGEMLIFISLDIDHAFNQNEITWDLDYYEDNPLKYDLYSYIKDLVELDAVEVR